MNTHTLEDLLQRLILKDDPECTDAYQHALSRADLFDGAHKCQKAPGEAKMIDYERRRLSWEHRGKRKCWGLRVTTREALYRWSLERPRPMRERCHIGPRSAQCSLPQPQPKITIVNHGLAAPPDIARMVARALEAPPQMTSALDRVAQAARALVGNSPMAQRLKAAFSATAEKTKPPLTQTF